MIAGDAGTLVNMKIEIRVATSEDAAQIATIYAPAVEESPVSFETEAPDEAEVARRVEETVATYPWLVAERGHEIISYVYARRLRPRPAYDWDVEATVFVKDGYQGRGVGRAIYTALLDVLTGQGFVNVYAVITVPNEASVDFHRAMGFKRAGAFPAAGFKFGAWHTIEMWYLQLGDLPDAPQPPIPFGTFRDFPTCAEILEQASHLLND